MEDLKMKLQLMMAMMNDKGFSYPNTTRPGLQFSEVAGATSALPITLPDEVACLYTLCDGVFVDEDNPTLPVGFFRGHWMLSLSEAIKEYYFLVDEDLIPGAWFPIFTDAYGFICVMVDQGDGVTAPLIEIEIEGGGQSSVFSSVADLFTLCIEMMNSGAFHPDEDGFESGKGSIRVNMEMYKEAIEHHGVKSVYY